MNGRVLIIAGSDSGGGAGIQADIKTVTALGGFAMTAITALTAQNTTGVQGIHEVPADFISQQMHSVIDDLGADAVKIGMLHRPEIIEAVANVLADKLPDVPVVLDPVMIATSGARLIEDAAVEALVERLLPCADLLIPNAPEAAARWLAGGAAGHGGACRLGRRGARTLRAGPPPPPLRSGPEISLQGLALGRSGPNLPVPPRHCQGQSAMSPSPPPAPSPPPLASPSTSTSPTPERPAPRRSAPPRCSLDV